MNESSLDDAPDDGIGDDLAGVLGLRRHNARGKLAEDTYDALTDAPHLTIDE